MAPLIHVCLGYLMVLRSPWWLTERVSLRFHGSLVFIVSLAEFSLLDVETELIVSLVA